MNDELEAYYDDLREMFATAGWKHLIQDYNDNLLNVNSIVNTKDANDMWFRKGQANVILSIINLEENILLSQKQSENSNAENL
jgi:hypothetical protein